MDNNIIEKNISKIKTETENMINDFNKLMEYCNGFSKELSNIKNSYNIKAEFYKKFMECLNYEDLRLCPSTPKDVVLFKCDLDKFSMRDVEEFVEYLKRCFPNYEIVAIPKENQIQTIPRNELIEFLEKTIKELKEED